MVSNAVSVLISIEHLNISMKIFQVNLFMTEKRAELISSKTVKRLNLETSLRDAMNACKDWKLSAGYSFTFGDFWPGSL